MHEERVDARTRGQRRLETELDDLPDGAFVLHEGSARLVLGPQLLRWSPAGYGDRLPRPPGARMKLLTPPSLVHVLRVGWRPVVPLVHPSARATAAGRI